MTYPITRGAELFLAGNAVRDDDKATEVRESWSSTVSRAEWIEDFKDFNPWVIDLLERLPEEVGVLRLNDRTVCDQWHFYNGKVILAGDAAHAMLPHAGAGCGQGLEDGFILGEAVAKYVADAGGKDVSLSSLLTSIARLYEHVRKPRASVTSAMSRDQGNVSMMQQDDMADKSLEECLPLVKTRTAAIFGSFRLNDLAAAFAAGAKQLDEGDKKGWAIASLWLPLPCHIDWQSIEAAE